VTFATETTEAPPRKPVPEFTYVPLRVAWEHCGGGACARTAAVAKNKLRIAPESFVMLFLLPILREREAKGVTVLFLISFLLS